MHLAASVDERRWGRTVGFPCVLVGVESLDEEAFMELSDSYGDALSDSGITLFDEEGWQSERYSLVAVLGVFDDPDSEELLEAFPYVAQMDGLVLWDRERSCALLMDGDMQGHDDFENGFLTLAESAESFLAQLV